MSILNKIDFIIKKATFFLALLFCFTATAQTYYSKRLNVGNKQNGAYSFKLHKDTFYIPALVYTFGPYTISSSLLKVDKSGSIIIQKIFKPAGIAGAYGYDLYVKNNKFYTCGDRSTGMKINAAFHVFNQSCDTIFMKPYGDTTYWNNGRKMQSYLKTKDKILLIGITDSTCGPPHSGSYKPFVRVVDTNGVLHQTNLYLTPGNNRTVTGSDTTLKKGYIISGVSNGYNYILKLDSNLSQDWVTGLPNSTISSYNSVVALKNGSYVVAHCKTDSFSGPNYWERAGLTKLGPLGNIIWQKYYGAKQTDIGVTSIKQLLNGEYIVCGTQRVKYTPSVTQVMGFIMQTDTSGNLKWWNNYIATTPVKDTIGDNYLFEVMELPNKSIAAVGYADGSGFFGTTSQSWLLHVDSMGCLAPGCTPTISKINELKDEELIVKAYPNPFNDALTIAYELDERYKNGNLAIIEPASGRVLMNYPISELTGSTVIKTENLAAGVYMVKISGTDAPEKFLKVVNIK